MNRHSLNSLCVLSEVSQVSCRVIVLGDFISVIISLPSLKPLFESSCSYSPKVYCATQGKSDQAVKLLKRIIFATLFFLSSTAYLQKPISYMFLLACSRILI